MILMQLHEKPEGKTRTANNIKNLSTDPSLRQDNAPDLPQKPSLTSFNFLTPTMVKLHHISHYSHCLKSEGRL